MLLFALLQWSKAASSNPCVSKYFRFLSDHAERPIISDLYYLGFL